MVEPPVVQLHRHHFSSVLPLSIIPKQVRFIVESLASPRSVITRKVLVVETVVLHSDGFFPWPPSLLSSSTFIKNSRQSYIHQLGGRVAWSRWTFSMLIAIFCGHRCLCDSGLNRIADRIRGRRSRSSDRSCHLSFYHLLHRVWLLRFVSCCCCLET